MGCHFRLGEVEPARRLDQGPRLAVRPRAPVALQPAARPELPEHRMHPLHPRSSARRRSSRRPLVWLQQNRMRHAWARVIAMSLFPMFLKLQGRPCLVVGAGKVAESKIRSLLQSGAAVRVVAPLATPLVKKWARARKISWQKRQFASADLAGIFLTIVSTSSPEVNHQAFLEAHRRGLMCNVVPDPEQCHYYYPAVVRRGHLQIAISTAGHSPALAQRLRLQLQKQFGPEYSPS